MGEIQKKTVTIKATATAAAATTTTTTTTTTAAAAAAAAATTEATLKITPSATPEDKKNPKNSIKPIKYSKCSLENMARDKRYNGFKPKKSFIIHLKWSA